MAKQSRIWLINNEASGSNDEAALAACEDACSTCGLDIAFRTVFPVEELPTPETLDAADIDTVAIYAGDGTVNAVLEALRGWSGAVLVLPGGTMNLLYHRLFGDLSMEEALEAVGSGKAHRRRPGVIETNCGTAYAGLLAGPGAAWGYVREAMRDVAPLEVAESAREAMDETLHGDRIRCAEPELGRREGYPLILLTPVDAEILADAYHADDNLEFLHQLFALVRREFRDGPHDRIGGADRFVLESVDGSGFGMLLDGEPCDVSESAECVLVTTELDLLATRHDG